MITQPLVTVGNEIVTYVLLVFLGIIVHAISDADNGRQ